MVSELEQIFRAVTIPSPGVVLFAGQPVQVAGATAKGGTMNGVPANGKGAHVIPTEEALISALTSEIYARCYTLRLAENDPNPYAMAQPDPAHDQALSTALSAAAGGESRWDPGWRIERTFPSGQLAVNKFGQVRAVWPGEFMTHDGPGIAPRNGAMVSVHAPGESRTLQPGFHFFFGSTITDYQDECDIVRFYWNIDAAGAPALASSLVRALNAYGIPFRFKTLSSSLFYIRRDSAVLFITRRLYRIVAELLRDVHREVASSLAEDTPLFTKRLARGLGFAEDPGNGQSFGMDRCRMVAEGILNAWKMGSQGPAERMCETTEVFARKGVTMEQPYINSGSQDVYGFAP